MNQDSTSYPTLVEDPVSSAWGTPLAAAACPACRSSFMIPVESQSAPCPFCFSAILTPQSDPRIGATPELVIPFTVDRQASGAIFENWLKGIWIRPADFSVQALLGRLTASFIPMWLVDGTVAGAWQAQTGFNYEVASSKEDYAGGSWTTQKLSETRILWEPRNGTIERSYSNLPVPALESHSRFISGLGRYPMDQAVLYTPNLIHGTPVRLPDRPVEKAWPQAKARLDQAACLDCQAAAGAQHIDQCTITAEYPQLHWTLLLLPVLSTYYRDDEGRITPVWVNGRTGQVLGLRKASQSTAWRWTGLGVAAGLACIVVALILSLLTAVFPPAVLLGGILFIAGILILLVSPIPAVWAWQFNRNTREQ